jgi:hypothetical protein
MNDQQFLDKTQFELRTKAALEWLKRSFDVNNRHGSSAYYSQFWKPFSWSLAYPETTGYIIETLLDYDQLFPEMKLCEYAIHAADWICTLQLPNGALPGGFSNSKNPSIFNTGQMIFGLIRAYEFTKNNKYFNVFRAAVNWLVENLEEEGSWRIGAYREGFVPSYYTRVIWPILLSNKYIENNTISKKMKLALGFYQNKLTAKDSIRDWSFKKGQKAFTHTIAYTIRGFYESSLLMDDKNLNEFTVNLINKVMMERELKGKLAGWYDEDWNGDYKFICLTGNCQMSIIFSRVYENNKDVRYLNTALKLFGDIINKQNLGHNINKRGAIPGSSPFSGRYLALRYPNWATKFFLDAYRLLEKNVKKIRKDHGVNTYMRL